MKRSLEKMMAAAMAGDLPPKEILALEERLAAAPPSLKKWRDMQTLADAMTRQAGHSSQALSEDFTHRTMSRILEIPDAITMTHKYWLTRALLPATPSEMGLALASVGVFFLATGLALLLGLFTSGIDPGLMTPVVPLALFPALLACALLLFAGLRQIGQTSDPDRPGARVVTAMALFGLTAVTGLVLKGHFPLTLALIWYGAAGLLTTGILSLVWKIPFDWAGFPQGTLPCRRRAPGTQGFTLIEIVTVLLLMGILALVAVASMGNDPSKVAGRAESITSHLRYVQAKAMNTGPLYEDQHSWGVSFPDNTSYFLFHCTDPASCTPGSSRVHPPGEDALMVQMGGDGVTVTRSIASTIIAFDRFGRPFSDEGLNATALLDEILTLTVSDGSGNSRSITIRPETGLIE